ncbi:hypothetical protein BGZ73_002062 [Actinomortierella ambigua]|nr:hypothetical protein BGZ73_002062 [Actinomortierella ambigua]
MAQTTLPLEATQPLLDHLEQYLQTLQSGFPTSTRPNEPPLTVPQKRAKIASTLERDPALFLSKWGSVLLYAPPPPGSLSPPSDQQVPQQSKDHPTSVHTTPSSAASANGGLTHLQTVRALLDHFRPLTTTDYEVRTHLQRLDRQWAQLYEREQFRQRRQAAHQQQQQQHNHHFPNRQDPHSTATTKSATDPELLLAWSTVSETTRKNRRLNYLLQTLAPPDPAVAGSGVAASTAASGDGSGNALYTRHPSGNATTATSTSTATGMHAGRRPSLDRNALSTSPAARISLAQMTSLSGSLANLSFADSTYFSDAEMEARAPELYQQYIGRFLDQEEDDDEEMEDEEEEEEEEEEDDDRDDEAQNRRQRQRQRKQRSVDSAPFDASMGLVDRILWSMDHPTQRQLKQQRKDRREQEQKEKNESNATSHGAAATGAAQSKQPRSSSSMSQQRQQPKQQPPPRHIQGQHSNDDDFEEEFDTESEVEDETEMLDIEVAEAAAAEDLAVTREVKQAMSMTPKLPASSGNQRRNNHHRSNDEGDDDSLDEQGRLSSTMASAAATLAQPEARAKLAQIANGNDSGDDASEDEALLRRKEYQEALRQEFVLLMKQRFIDGLDETFDYSTVDYDEELDDLDQEAHDAEDQWFDHDDDDDDMEELQYPSRATLSAQVPGHPRKHPLRWDYEARLNETPKDMGDYDY